MFKDFKEFRAWEKVSQDTIDFKKIYVDVADDLVAGLLLSQVVYWYLPDKNGKTKLRVKHGGHLWIVKKRTEWYDEIRLSEANYKTAIKKLEKKNIIVKEVHRFDKKPTTFLRLNISVFLKLMNEAMIKSQINTISEEEAEFEEYLEEQIQLNEESSNDAVSVESTGTDEASRTNVSVESTETETVESTGTETVESTETYETVESTETLTENNREHLTENNITEITYSSSLNLDKILNIDEQTEIEKNEEEEITISESTIRFISQEISNFKIFNDQEDINTVIKKLFDLKILHDVSKRELHEANFSFRQEMTKGSIKFPISFFVNGVSMAYKERKRKESMGIANQAFTKTETPYTGNVPFYNWLEQ